MNERILVVEDTEAILDAVTDALAAEGFDVRGVSDGKKALEIAEAEPFDLIILDLMLPRLSGTEICRRLRAESAVPIIILTARDSEADRVLGFEIGADDYITKPFSASQDRTRPPASGTNRHCSGLRLQTRSGGLGRRPGPDTACSERCPLDSGWTSAELDPLGSGLSAQVQLAALPPLGMSKCSTHAHSIGHAGAGSVICLRIR